MPVSTRNPLLLSATLVAAAPVACDRPDSPADAPRNLVLISIDTLRADRVGCYGGEADTTPNLDALAAKGARFAHVVAESSWTLPTHATMLTGVRSGVHGMVRETARLPAGLPTLAEMLRGRGYETHGVYSAPLLHPVYGFGRGFPEGGYEAVGVDESAGRNGPIRRLDAPPTSRSRASRSSIARSPSWSGAIPGGRSSCSCTSSTRTTTTSRPRTTGVASIRTTAGARPATSARSRRACGRAT